MAANMAQMGGGPGQMMPQHQGMQQGVNPQLTAYLVNTVKNTPIPPNGITWQSTLMHQERVNKLMQLVTQLNMAGGGNMQNAQRIVDQSLAFERQLYNSSQSKEHYMNQFDTKLKELLARRQANAPNLQNHLNNQAAAQAQQQQQQQQAQAMMNMHTQQMGRGMSQQGLQQMQRQMQMPNMPQQQQQQFRPQQQPQFPQQQQLHAQQQQQQQLHAQQMALNAGNQAGRGMAQNQSMLNQASQQPQFPLNMSALAEIQKLGNTDKQKVSQVATNLFKNAPEEQRAQARNHMRQLLTPTQLQELQAQGRDPATYFFQIQAFYHLKAGAARNQQHQQQQQGFPGPGGQQQPPSNPQAAMMQQQRSQQNAQQLQQQQQQQRQNLAGMGSQDSNDFSPFPSNLQSIHNQQMSGLMAENAGQMVVPASNRPNTATSQPMAQSMSSQTQNQNPNRTPRQPPTQPTPQGHANAGAHQMSTVQQSQAQLQAQQLKQLQGQQNMMQSTQQSPPMGTLNTPAARPANMSTQPPASAFGDQRFNTAGFQGSNQQMVATFMANIPANERPRVQAMSPQEMQALMRRWYANRQAQSQMANRSQGMAQNNANMAGQQPQQLNPAAQPMGQGVGNNPMARTPANSNVHPQAQQMMDNMDMPQNVISHMPGLPPEVKKWRDLKVWLGRNNQLPPNVRENLGNWQHKQFQVLMQKQREMRAQQAQQQAQQQQQQAQAQVQAPQQTQQPTAQMQQQPGLQQRSQQQMQHLAQNPPMAGMPGFGGPLQQQNPQPQVPAQILQVTDQEIRQVRESRPQAANATDQQLKQFILRAKFDNWQKQQHVHLQAQAAARQKMSQMGGFTQPNGRTTPGGQIQAPNQIQVQPQPNGQQQQQGMQRANALGPPGPQPQGQQQTPMQEQKPQVANNRSKKQQNQATPSPAQAGKNLKRPMADLGADVDTASLAGQQQRKSFQSQSSKSQAAAMSTGEDPNNMQTSQGQARPTPSQAQQAQSAGFLRLKSIGAEEQRNDKQTIAQDIPMSPEVYEQTLNKLRRISFDMNKIGQGLAKWYGLANPNERDNLARLFFRSRNRIVKQFLDGPAATQPRPVFSITQAEVDSFRVTLEAMARDITKHVQQKAKTQQGQQGGFQAQDGANAQRQLMAQKAQEAQQAAQATQPPAEQQAPPAPLNAANLEKNAQALKNQKAAGKNNKPPTAPTTAQPPFSLHASSPHGNPRYNGKPKDINLQLPPARKKAKLDKVAGQGSQAATPSPKTTMRTPPVPQPMIPQEPPRPVLTCKDDECQGSLATFDSEQSLQQHIEDEHLKPRQDPLKFFSENLALALGLDPTGVIKKDAKQHPAVATMSRTASKQAATPAYLGTPKSMDGHAMKRSASAQSKVDAKPHAAAAARSAPASPEVWAKASYNSQGVLAMLGIPEGISSVFKNMTYMRYLMTPKETPESTKGSSEPSTDAFEFKVDYDGPDVKWFSFDEVDATNLLGSEDDSNVALPAQTGLGNVSMSLDPMLLQDPPSMGVVDWDNDFSKPFQWDTSQYSFPEFVGAAS